MFSIFKEFDTGNQGFNQNNKLSNIVNLYIM